jgi:SSS family transporter
MSTPPLLLAAFGRLDWLVIAAYLGLMALIGTLASRRKTDAEGYFLAERKMPVWMVALSVVATSLSVATFVGAPQSSFAGDLTYLSINLGAFVAVFVVGLLFIPSFYRAGTVTIYGYLDQRYGRVAMVAVSCMFLFGRLLASGVRLFIAAIPVCLLIFGEEQGGTSKRQLVIAICIIGAVGTAYTIAGGIKAVIWTDTVQIIIVIGAAVLSIILLLQRIPLSVTEIVKLLSDPTVGPHGSKLMIFDWSWDSSRSYTIWSCLIGYTFLATASYGVDHDLAQRMLTARSAWRGGLSLIASQFISLGVISLFLIIGLLLYIFYNRPDVMGALAPSDKLRASQEVYAQFLLRHLPTGLCGLAIAGMLAAAQGSLDSAINAMASSAVADLYWPWRKWRGQPVEAGVKAKAPRLAVAGMGAMLILVAIGAAYIYDPKQKTLIDFALDVMAFAYTGMLGVFLAALLTRRGNSASVLAALMAGVITTTLLQDGIVGNLTMSLFHHRARLAGFWRMPIGTIISFAVCCATSGSGRASRPTVQSGRLRDDGAIPST